MLVTKTLESITLGPGIHYSEGLSRGLRSLRSPSSGILQNATHR